MANGKIRRGLIAALNGLAHRWGFQVSISRIDHFSSDFTQYHNDVFKSVRPYTMTSIERISAVCDAVEYVVQNNVPGAFVECGVWRGGATMAAAKTLIRRNGTDRSLWLFDTFSGMSQPGSREDATIHANWSRQLHNGRNGWCFASLADVQRNIASTGYPEDRVHFVEGKVEDTLPSQAPNQIAVLRLDTDWYESTAWELKHLFPRLSRGGVLIVDDYGHWAGARAAVDEYFREQGLHLLMCRTDYTGRMAIKL